MVIEMLTYLNIITLPKGVSETTISPGLRSRVATRYRPRSGEKQTYDVEGVQRKFVRIENLKKEDTPYIIGIRQKIEKSFQLQGKEFLSFAVSKAICMLKLDFVKTLDWFQLVNDTLIHLCLNKTIAAFSCDIAFSLPAVIIYAKSGPYCIFHRHM